MWFYELEINGQRFKSYDEFLGSEYWYQVNVAYDKSNLPKYCFICDSPNYILHHEDYGILGRELIGSNLSKLIALCSTCHHQVHFDEEGEKIPLKPWFLEERRLMLRKKYIYGQLLRLKWISLSQRLVYRLFW